jgi:galactitol-specific phosphotransferase system IIB component
MDKLELALFGNVGKDKETLFPNDGKMIGFYGSKSLDSSLVLLGIANGLNKSQMLRKIVSEYCQQHDPAPAMVGRLMGIYETQGHEMGIALFKKKVREHLEKHKIDKALIARVLEML